MRSERMQYVYGVHPVAEVLRAQPGHVRRLLIQPGEPARLAELRRLAERQGIAIEETPRQALQRHVGRGVHQGIVAQVAPFEYAELNVELQRTRAVDAPAPLWLVLDQVQDPHNLGALIRSASALGADALLMAKDRACEITATVHKAAAGATAHLPIVRVTNLCRGIDALRGAGLWTVGTVPDAPKILGQLDLVLPTALVIGAEGRGMRRLVAAHCDHLVKIPMAQGLASLNASVAGAIGLYEAARQRGLDPVST